SLENINQLHTNIRKNYLEKIMYFERGPSEQSHKKPLTDMLKDMQQIKTCSIKVMKLIDSYKDALERSERPDSIREESLLYLTIGKFMILHQSNFQQMIEKVNGGQLILTSIL